MSTPLTLDCTGASSGGTPGTLLELSDPLCCLPLTLTPSLPVNTTPPTFGAADALPNHVSAAAPERAVASVGRPALAVRSPRHAANLSEACHVPPGGWWPHILSNANREAVEDMLEALQIEAISDASPYRSAVYSLAQQMVSGDQQPLGLAEIADLASGRPVGIPPGLWQKLLSAGSSCIQKQQG